MINRKQPTKRRPKALTETASQAQRISQLPNPRYGRFRVLLSGGDWLHLKRKTAPLRMTSNTPAGPNASTPGLLKRPRRLWLLLAAIVLVVLATVVHKRPVYHPEIVFQAAEQVQVSLIKQPYNTPERCAQSVRRLEIVMRKYCPDCTFLAAHCISKLSPRQRTLLLGQNIDMPTLRIAKGVMGFESPLPELAQQTCRQAAEKAGGMHRCVPAGSTSAVTQLAGISKLQLEFKPSSKTLLQLTLFAAAVSFLLCAFLIASERWHSRYSHDMVGAGPQKFHTTPVPRIGGIAIACAIGLTLLGLDAADLLMTDSVYGFALLALAALPAFAGGLAEDLTKKVGVLARLLLTMTAGVLASVLTGATLVSLDVPGLDELLQWSPLIAIAFTAFAAAGVANAINIIDGYNGLASGFAILALCTLAWVAFKVSDQVVLLASLTMLGAVLGFFCWNWPGGRIFMGDGGAYLVGFWLAELGVLLVVRNPEVSPWFPMAVMIYPIWETLYSIYRRQNTRQGKVGEADSSHLHQLVHQIYLRHREKEGNDTNNHRNLNHKVMPFIMLALSPCLLISAIFWSHTSLMVAICLVVGGAYLLVYRKLANSRGSPISASASKYF